MKKLRKTTAKKQVLPKRKAKTKVSRAEFARYVRVQESGRFNMLMPEARCAAVLSKEKYDYIINNYEKLEALYAAKSNV